MSSAPDNEKFPVKVVIYCDDVDGKEVCLTRYIETTTESKYYFGAEPMRNKALADLIQKCRVELTLTFPPKDALG